MIQPNQTVTLIIFVTKKIVIALFKELFVTFIGVMSAVDQSVGEIVKTLSEANMLENTVILFFSDNGGQTVGSTFPNFSSNYPLRGVSES